MDSKFNIGDEVLELVGDQIYLVKISKIYLERNQITYELESEEANEYRGLYNERQWEEDQIGDSLAEYEKTLVVYQEVLSQFPMEQTLTKEELLKIRNVLYTNLRGSIN